MVAQNIAFSTENVRSVRHFFLFSQGETWLSRDRCVNSSLVMRGIWTHLLSTEPEWKGLAYHLHAKLNFGVSYARFLKVKACYLLLFVCKLMRPGWRGHTSKQKGHWTHTHTNCCASTANPLAFLILSFSVNWPFIHIVEVNEIIYYLIAFLSWRWS